MTLPSSRYCFITRALNKKIDLEYALQLESPLIFSDQVAAIPLAKNDPAVNSRVTVAGWGRLKVSNLI